MKICFITSSIEFDVETPLTQPLGGSESCVCYLAKTLALRGHSIYLLSQNKNPGVRAGCVCLDINDHLSTAFFAAHQFDAVILVNFLDHIPAIRTHILPPDATLLLWCHHDSDQPLVTDLAEPAMRQYLDAIVFVSQYQRQRAQQAFDMNDRESTVIHNGLTPAFAHMFDSPESVYKAKRDADIVVYSSTPFRGLKILLEVMSNTRSGVRLKSFAGMSVYQASDTPFAQLFARGARLTNVELIGPVPQPQLAHEMKSASYFVYPNSFAETFCIAAIEALACGLDLLVTDRGALREVCGDFATYIPADIIDNNVPSAISLISEMLDAQVSRKRSNPEKWSEAKYEQALSVSAQYSWESRALELENMLYGRLIQRRQTSAYL